MNNVKCYWVNRTEENKLVRINLFGNIHIGDFLQLLISLSGIFPGK